MTEQNLDIVVGKHTVVVKNLIEGVAEGACVGLAQTASLIGGVAVVLVVRDCALVVVEVGSQVHCQPQTVEQGILSDGS